MINMTPDQQAKIIDELRDFMISRGWSRPKAKIQASMWVKFIAPRILATVGPDSKFDTVQAEAPVKSGEPEKLDLILLNSIKAEIQKKINAGDTIMGGFEYRRGARNVSYLDAQYILLVAAFGNDGTVGPRDVDKSEAEWDVKTPYGTVEVYDYSDPHTREDITEWHVQGDPKAITHMLAMVKIATVKIGTAAE